MKSINKITALNIFSTVLLQGIAFFTTPIFTRMLGTEQYGLYSVFASWVSIFTCFMGLGVSNALATGMYQFKEKYEEFRSSLLLLGALISLFMIGVGILFIRPISMLLKYTGWQLFLALLSAFAHYQVSFVQSACIYEKKAGINFIMSLSLSALSVGLSIILISGFRENNLFMGRIYGVVIPYVLIAGIMSIAVFCKRPEGLHWDYTKFGLIIGVPIIFHTLAHNILSQSDRVMMQHLNISNSEIGIYSLYYTFAGVLSTILNALNTSWCPFYYDDVDSQNWEKLNRKCKNYIELFSVLAVGFLLLSREVSYILAGSEYRAGTGVIPVITFAVYFTFMYQFPVNFEFFHKKTKIIAVGTIGAAIVNIILNLILIPKYGMYGAGAATAVSYLALFVFHYEIVTHMKRNPYHMKVSSFFYGILSVGTGAVLFYILADFWYVRWGIGIVIGILELKKIIRRKTIF